MDKPTLLKARNTIPSQLIKEYKPERNGRQTINCRLETINRPETIDYRLETLDNGKGIIIKRRGKWINF